MPNPSIYEIYADESSQTKRRYLALGALGCTVEDALRIESTLIELCDRNRLYGEVKWSKVSNGMLFAYVDLVNMVFNEIDRGILTFRSLIADTTLFDHTTYNSGDREIGFNKLIYQLLLNRFGAHFARRGEHLHVHLDARTTKQSLESLRGMLNHGIRKSWKIDNDPFRRVQFMDSHESMLIQANDLLLGAVAFCKNGSDQVDGASKAKLHLAELIRTRARLRNLCDCTPRATTHFTIWNFRLQPRR